MIWEQLTAIGSLAGAVVLVVGSVAAVIQLKHLRLANQIDSYLAIMQRLASPEMVDAREYVESLNLEDPRALSAAFENGLDPRIMLFGGYCQMVARLINLGIADPVLFTSFRLAVAPMWRSLRPIAYEMRRRGNGNMRWLDIEHLVYRNQFDLRYSEVARGYSPELLRQIGFPESIEIARRENTAALGTPAKV